MAFIAVGAMRKYYLDEKGVEHIVDLYIEGWWAVDRESYVMSTPSMYNIDAVEECVVYLISRRNTFKLCSEYAPFNEFILNLDEHHQIATQRRITFSIGSSADKRYSDLVARHPYFIQRFPQHFIASYLGMSKDTLSRIRRKSLFK